MADGSRNAPPAEAGPKKWNVRNVMSWGVFIGPVVLYAHSHFFGPPAGVTDPDGITHLAGGAIGGSVVFAAIALIRNALVK